MQEARGGAGGTCVVQGALWKLGATGGSAHGCNSLRESDCGCVATDMQPDARETACVGMYVGGSARLTSGRIAGVHKRVSDGWSTRGLQRAECATVRRET